jgi:hypothetical protein
MSALPVGLTFTLTRRQRLLWSLGSPTRAVGVLAVTIGLCWLSIVSIGWSAVCVLVIILLSGHWLSYVLAGRNRLTVDLEGVYDHARFHKRFYPWSDVIDLQVGTPVRHLHGLVIQLTDPPGPPVQKFLRSSWRPSVEEAQAVLTRMQDANPAFGPQGSVHHARPAAVANAPWPTERAIPGQ